MKKKILKLWKRNAMLVALSVFLMCLSSVSQTMAQESGENYTIDLPGKQKLDMVWIEAGTFKMGSPEKELGRFAFEVQHEVTISKEFWLGKYEVTQAQWNAVMGSNKSYYIGDNLPVIGVKWKEAMEFCEELTKMEKKKGNLPEGYKYTLPTDAQWEYACRAGTRTSLNSGKNITTEDGKCPNLDKVGWYKENSSGTPHPVGKKEPNEWGLYDMHGNAEEWCLDWHVADLGTNAVTDPMGPSSGSHRVLRGGDMVFPLVVHRSAFRCGDDPDSDYGHDRVGFRVCLSYSSKP